MDSMTNRSTQGVVEVQYHKLVEWSAIEQAAADDQVLLTQQIQQALPDETKELYADPASVYNFGWSHGVERMANGQPDRHKGSYYANPLVDAPTTDETLMKQYPAYCRPNIWPTQHLPQYQSAFQTHVSCGLPHPMPPMRPHFTPTLTIQPHPGSLPLAALTDKTVVRQGRLLHYFPPETSKHDTHQAAADVSSSLTNSNLPSSSTLTGNKENDSSKHSRQEEEDWCGWHTDHGSLTGLTSAMYMSGDEVVPSPDPQAGLYIRARQGGEVTQVRIPSDHIAYQMGEAMQVMSGGLLRATPHCVKAPHRDMSGGVSRNTLAVFMQPRWDTIMELPEGGLYQPQVGVGQWQPGISFGNFAERTVHNYYHAKE